MRINRNPLLLSIALHGVFLAVTPYLVLVYMEKHHSNSVMVSLNPGKSKESLQQGAGAKQTMPRFAHTPAKLEPVHTTLKTAIAGRLTSQPFKPEPITGLIMGSILNRRDVHMASEPKASRPEDANQDWWVTLTRGLGFETTGQARDWYESVRRNPPVINVAESDLASFLSFYNLEVSDCTETDAPLFPISMTNRGGSSGRCCKLLTPRLLVDIHGAQKKAPHVRNGRKLALRANANEGSFTLAAL